MIDQSRLATQELADYRAVALLDPQPLTARRVDEADRVCRAGAAAWRLSWVTTPSRSASFQDAGGDRRARGQADAADAHGRRPVPRPAVVRSSDHCRRSAQVETNVPWDRFPVFFHWNLDELADSRPHDHPLWRQQAGRGREPPGPRPRADADDADFRPAAAAGLRRLEPPGDRRGRLALLHAGQRDDALSRRQRAGAAEPAGRRDGRAAQRPGASIPTAISSSRRSISRRTCWPATAA